MELTGFTSVSTITVICYLIIQGIKVTPLDTKWLPLISGVLGGVLGIVGSLVMADFPAADLLTALAVGIASGLAATGANQVYKQLGSTGDGQSE